MRYDEESDTHWVYHRKNNNITSDIENDFYFRYPSKCIFFFFLIIAYLKLIYHFIFLITIVLYVFKHLEYSIKLQK